MKWKLGAAGAVLLLVLIVWAVTRREPGDVPSTAGPSPSGTAGTAIDTPAASPSTPATSPAVPSVSVAGPGPLSGPTAPASPLPGALDRPAPSGAAGEGPPDLDADAREPGRPPMDAPPSGPPSLATEMHHLMRQVRDGGGPPVDEHAEAMLASDDPLMRAVGAALLSASDRLPDEALQQIAADPDTQVPLMVLGWLEDTGHSEQAFALAEMLRAQGVGAGDLAALVGSRSLDSIAARAALDLLRNDYPADDLADLLIETSIDLAQDHDVRMKAVLLLRDTMPFEDYREEVRLLSENTRGQDPLWDESLRRELNRLQGPAEVLDRPPSLSSSSVDERLAREYPAMLSDLALYVETVLEDEAGVAAAGTTDTLQAYVDAYKKRPWTDEQQFDLARLEGMLADLRKLEEATHDRAVDDRPPF